LFCDNAACRRQIFSERFPGLGRDRARRTERLQAAQLAIGFALGGEAGAQLARQLGMVVSADTLLRQLHRAPLPTRATPQVLGVDDWAYRRGHHYGTILVDLEHHQPVDLLPDREAASLRQWLKAHPGVKVMSRDRSEAYAKGAREGAPNACQVADRWHLMKNLREGVQQLLTRYQGKLKHVAQAQADQGQWPLPAPSPATPAPPTTTSSSTEQSSTERAQQARRQRRQARYQEVITLGDF
jgi:transposase